MEPNSVVSVSTRQMSMTHITKGESIWDVEIALVSLGASFRLIDDKDYKDFAVSLATGGVASVEATQNVNGS